MINIINTNIPLILHTSHDHVVYVFAEFASLSTPLKFYFYLIVVFKLVALQYLALITFSNYVTLIHLYSNQRAEGKCIYGLKTEQDMRNYTKARFVLHFFSKRCRSIGLNFKTID